MKKIAFILLNILTGFFVVVNSLVAYAISGIGEESTNNLTFLIWILVWAIGFALQFKERTKIIGLVITFIPVVFFLYVYIAASMM